jgi:hypothetical protein
MTAHAMSNDKLLSLEAGMNDHVNKPINVAELFATMVKWIPKKTPEAGAPESETIEAGASEAGAPEAETLEAGASEASPDLSDDGPGAIVESPSIAPPPDAAGVEAEPEVENSSKLAEG